MDEHGLDQAFCQRTTITHCFPRIILMMLLCPGWYKWDQMSLVDVIGVVNERREIIVFSVYQRFAHRRIMCTQKKQSQRIFSILSCHVDNLLLEASAEIEPEPDWWRFTKFGGLIPEFTRDIAAVAFPIKPAYNLSWEWRLTELKQRLLIEWE